MTPKKYYEKIDNSLCNEVDFYHEQFTVEGSRKGMINRVRAVEATIRLIRDNTPRWMVYKRAFLNRVIIYAMEQRIYYIGKY